MSANTEIAHQNMQALSENTYPGRGMVMGRSTEGEFVQVYWIMGRHPDSRNRRFVIRGEDVWTDPLEGTKPADPSLIIYRAMAHYGPLHIVSNGDQTDTVYNYYNLGEGNKHITEALKETHHETDKPHNTSRITGLIDVYDGSIIFSKIMKLPGVDSERTSSAHMLYEFGDKNNGVDKGYGFCLHTYNENGNPLPAFDRDPYLVRLDGYVNEIANTYWDLLNKENRVALVVKTIKPYPLSMMIKNSGIKIINAA